MSHKLKLTTILGTRPEIIRLSSFLKKADKYFDHTVVHTGQNWDYELNEVFFKELGLRAPDHFLDAAGEHLGESIGNIIARSYEVLSAEDPDAVLVLGDTNSALAAISAKRLKIPIFHMEAGNRCWDWNVSEMINRKIVDHIADVNLPYTENARRYLLEEGLDSKMIFVTGSPMPEVIDDHLQEIAASEVLEKLNLESGGYFLVSAHREENIDNEANFTDLMSSINFVAEHYGIPVIFGAHPRSKKFITERGFTYHPLVKVVKPFGFLDYIALQKNARCVLSDSGTLSEESAILGFPSVLIRTSTERPEVLDSGSIVVGGITKRTVQQAIDMAIAMRNDDETFSMPDDYRDKNVSAKVCKIIQSYTDIVNRTIWLKS